MARRPVVDGFDALVLPGGFAHGDYLRPGALARFSPVMEAVTRFAADGGPVVGICNGFQVLTEAGLLPGAPAEEQGSALSVHHRRSCRWSRTRTPLTAGTDVGAVLRLPVNHFEGNYICDAATLARLRDEDRIVLRYTDNPNGSVDDIAGICNAAGNVVGLMPHPERACDALTGATDGMPLLRRCWCTDRVPPVPPWPALRPPRRAVRSSGLLVVRLCRRLGSAG